MIVSQENHGAPMSTYLAARKYLAGGLSVIPIRAGGGKEPAVREWKQFQRRLPGRAELRDWFMDRDDVGIAIIGGTVSGGLEIIDFDNIVLFKPWLAKLKKRRPGLAKKLVVVGTPRPGRHVYFRSRAAGANQKLARVQEQNAGRRICWKTAIETRGEGGYVLAPPSPGTCHPSGRQYKLVSQRDLPQIATVRRADRLLMLDLAREFDEAPPREERAWIAPTRPAGSGLRPGDEFNIRGDWGAILEPHGWRFVGHADDGSGRWRRPSKKEGVSATTDYAGCNRLYVFSSNADPFEPDSSYSKFAAYTLLNHNGDFHAAAHALREEGFGGVPILFGAIIDPYSKYDSPD